jgi:L-ascorbate 6-phosphate lactonase
MHRAVVCYDRLSHVPRRKDAMTQSMEAGLIARIERLVVPPGQLADFFREQQDIVGNLWPREAVELAVAIQARVLIGIHNDLFDTNRVNPGRLFDELDRRAPWHRCHLLQPGELYLYAG